MWEELHRYQQNELRLAIRGESEEFELSDFCKYLQIDPETWYDWTMEKRDAYVQRFNSMKVEDFFEGKRIELSEMENASESLAEFINADPRIKDVLVNGLGYSEVLAEATCKATEEFINTPGASQKKPTLTHGRQKFLVASKTNKHGMNEVTLYKDHAKCSCRGFSYDNICKHSLSIATTTNILQQHLDHIVRKRNSVKNKSHLLKHGAEDLAGKKGGRHNNPWRPLRSGKRQQPKELQKHPFTEVHHNKKPFFLNFISDIDEQHVKASNECRSCRKEFPRRTRIVPFDVLLSHEEKWEYPDPQNPGKKLSSKLYTTKFYCVRNDCIMRRFPYFDAENFLDIPNAVMDLLHPSHLNLLKEELNYNVQLHN